MGSSICSVHMRKSTHKIKYKNFNQLVNHILLEQVQYSNCTTDDVIENNIIQQVEWPFDIYDSQTHNHRRLSIFGLYPINIDPKL